MRPALHLVLPVVLLALAGPAHAQDFYVEPYLQLATPDGITIAWETDGGDQARVEWGPDLDLGRMTDGVTSDLANGRHHIVRLEGLEPDTRYYYRARTGEAVSDIADFVTPHDHDVEAPVRLVALSDMQRDGGAPRVFEEIVRDGVIGYVGDRFGDDLARELAMVLIPGDLVDNGLVIDQWRQTFFAPAQPLFARVPVYPVPGNHENDSAYFFQYFVLPENGTPPWLEHWWSHDRSNLRVIGLDSNGGYRRPEQLDWLDLVLADACAEDRIDFVFAQLHHPHLSELWLAGETDYTGEVIERLEVFSSECGKPSLHFFGHTHGYSRGQSRDHHHLWVNVASAGGNLDRWGEFAQADHEEFVVSHDEYGFVLVEVEAGAEPEFRLTRVGQGQPGARVDNVVRDTIRIRRDNAAPEAPVARFPSGDAPVNPDCFDLAAGPFREGDGDTHQATHWQIAAACDGFDAPLVDRWRQDRNWYFGVDTQAGDDLTDERVEGFAPETEACWRVRYRDDSLGWSAWSAPTPFRTGPSNRGDNLVQNPGAEDGLDGWEQAEGISESLTANECEGVEPAAGARYFAVGGLCEESAYAELIQRVDLVGHADAIDASLATAIFGAMMSNYSGSDRPEMELRFVGADGAARGVSERVGVNAAGWRRVEDASPIPVGTRAADVVLMGTRNAGQDNDSYVDEVFVVIAEGAEGCDEAPPMEPDGGPLAPDAGVAEPDGGVAPDAGAVEPDAALSDAGRAPPDMAGAADAAPGDARLDAMPAADARPEADAQPDPPSAADGCGAASGGDSGPVGLLVLVGLLAVRRRRVDMPLRRKM